MLVLVFPLEALGAARYARDPAARRRISKAVAEQYLQMNFGQAEAELLDVIRECDDQCRKTTLAKAWMYIGIVRGSGKEDQHGARQAFDTALGFDKRVALDKALATSVTKKTYEDARRGRPMPAGPAAADRDEPAASEPAPDEAEPAPAERAGAGGLSCTPDERIVQTRRPVPIECRADGEAARLNLRYREHGGAPWKSMAMARGADSFRAQIPCSATMDSGTLEFYVVAANAAGEPVDMLGRESTPEQITIDPQRSSAPSFAGEPAPERCEEKTLCPPDFPGCVDDVTADDADDERSPSYAKSWLGVHFAADIGFIQGSNVCNAENTSFECFASGAETPYPGELPTAIAGQPGELGDAYPGTGISSGAAAGTMRALVSFDHAFSERISLGARLGYAFGGGPATLDGRRFLPIHVEGRAHYWLRPLSTSGWHPYVHLGGGLAQVDIKKGDVTVRDCSEAPARQAFLDCIAATNAYDSANDPELPTRTLDAYRKLGNAFVTAGGGFMLPLGQSTALQLNLNAMYMLPSSGLVLQPSLGFEYAL
ncbi:MAG TPA: hypothetical protein VMG12_14385 [Polyangiaceae bacterium]|nr:hypothetical protein [Polyangiaceae bacterium]